MHSRPPPYFYGQAYVVAFAGVLLLCIGVDNLEWQFFLIGFCLLVLSVVGLAYLAWWRRSFNEWHPDELDTELSTLSRISDYWSTRIVRAASNSFRRRD